MKSSGHNPRHVHVRGVGITTQVDGGNFPEASFEDLNQENNLAQSTFTGLSDLTRVAQNAINGFYNRA